MRQETEIAKKKKPVDGDPWVRDENKPKGREELL